jgi:hypothetical protein
VLHGCGPRRATSGAFTEVGRLESELRRGVSTKMDVRRVLGAPKGMGGAVIPTDPVAREVWFYSDIEITGMSGATGVVRANMRQQILLVFFQREVLDGFVWFSNAGVAKRP